MVCQNACMSACMLSRFCHVSLSVTQWTIARQAPLSMEFSRKEYWSGLPWPSPRDLRGISKGSSWSKKLEPNFLLNPGIEPLSLLSPALQVSSLLLPPPGKPLLVRMPAVNSEIFKHKKQKKKKNELKVDVFSLGNCFLHLHWLTSSHPRISTASHYSSPSVLSSLILFLLFSWILFRLWRSYMEPTISLKFYFIIAIFFLLLDLKNYFLELYYFFTFSFKPSTNFFCF